MALRKLIGSYLPKGKKLPEIPEAVPAYDIPAIGLSVFTPLWDNLPVPVDSPQPGTFESYNQDYGFVLYRTELKGNKKGKLTLTDLHDYATVFLNGKYLGYLDRREGINSIDIPESGVDVPVLEILVEGMGRINYGQYIVDRKGITEKVTLVGETLLNWKVYNLPMDQKFIYNLRSSAKNTGKEGIFYKGSFFLSAPGDSYFDMSNFKKGILWINGHNLGRYWNIGPQKRLYCPASFMRKGQNEMIVFDLHQMEPQIVVGFKTLQ